MLWHAELPCARWIGCIKKMKLPSAYCALNWMSKKPFCILNGMCWTKLNVFCMRWTKWTENDTADRADHTGSAEIRLRRLPGHMFSASVELELELRRKMLLHRAEPTEKRRNCCLYCALSTELNELYDITFTTERRNVPWTAVPSIKPKTVETMCTCTAHWHGRWKLVHWLIGGAPRSYPTLIGAKLTPPMLLDDLYMYRWPIFRQGSDGGTMRYRILGE